MVSDIPASTSGGAREQQQQHPSPQRSRLSLYALIFGLAGAPFAALAQISIGAALAGIGPLGSPEPEGVPGAGPAGG